MHSRYDPHTSYPYKYPETLPRKTEYEIETKETMQREQRVIVLRTKEYCMYCVKNKGVS